MNVRWKTRAAIGGDERVGERDEPVNVRVTVVFRGEGAGPGNMCIGLSSTTAQRTYA